MVTGMANSAGTKRVQCWLCESMVRRLVRLGSERICPHCLAAIGSALASCDDYRDKAEGYKPK